MEERLIEEGLLSLQEVARRCGVSPGMLWRLCKQGKLECVRTSANGRWLTSLKAVTRYLAGVKADMASVKTANEMDIEQRAAIATAKALAMCERKKR